MLIEQRQNRLLELLRERGGAELDELAEALGVSRSTVRRDVEALERAGHARRTHGGAVPIGAEGTAEPSVALAARYEERVSEKKAIAERAAALVQPQMTLLLDGGSTVVYAAQRITARPLQVVTNSLSIANLFANDERVELSLLGGSLYPRTEVTVGPVAHKSLSDLHADLLLFSLAGIYGDACFNINLPMAELEERMLEQAARRVMLMDSGKFGRKSLVRVCRIDQVDAIVADDALESSWRERLGDRLLLAERAR